jgi:hypothetical protein
MPACAEGVNGSKRSRSRFLPAIQSSEKAVLKIKEKQILRCAMTGFKKLLPFFFSSSLLLLALLLTEKQASAIIATISNDLSANDPGAIIEVSNIKGQGLRPNLRFILNPGEKRRISGRNVFSFTLSRIFGATKERYVVACPKDPRIKDQITFRLIDIQNNAMPSGCILERTGTYYSDRGMVWDSKPHIGQ